MTSAKDPRRPGVGADPSTTLLVRPALAWFREHGGTPWPDVRLLREYLTVELPSRPHGSAGNRVDGQHELAWALGDLFEQAGRSELAALCRAREIHETFAVWQWTRSFPGSPTSFWAPALAALERPSGVPARAALSVSSARALLEAVGDGLRLTDTGHLPPATVAALDDRFRWTEEFPWMRRAAEPDVTPLWLLREHLVAQRLLDVDGSWLRRSPLGVTTTTSTARLWRALVDPEPRWSTEFERDTLGVVAASVLRVADFTLGRIAEETTHVLARKWRPAAEAERAARGGLYDGALTVAQKWYQLGVPLGWWDTGRGAADRIPNAWGLAAAVTVFRTVMSPVRG